MTDHAARAVIGIDFDNTIACYDHVFAPAAREMGLVPMAFAGSKSATRAAIRASDVGETGWMRLQGQVYGRLMGRARLFDGVLAFLQRCRDHGVSVAIVSHKTEYGHFDPDRVNLRDAALRWMADVGLFDTVATGLGPDRVFFESTRSAKLQRIAALGCTAFVDDLPEVFLDPDFPRSVRKCLFASDGEAPEGLCIPRAHWSEIADDLLDDH
jgi:hypothetical protein